MKFIFSAFENIGLENNKLFVAAYITAFLMIILLCIIAYFAAKKIVLRFVSHIIRKSKPEWNEILIKNRVFERISQLVPPVIISIFSVYFPSHTLWIQRIAEAYIVIVVLLIADAFLNSVEKIYKTHEISKTKPIKGFLQAVKICIYIIGLVIIVARLIGESPIILLGGIGALTAVVTLVFKDSILGFVAGIQLSANDMVRIGDWIEMPKYEADGTVIDLSLNTVKVENFDRTITSIPAYALISDAFKNWRNMENVGGRRIMRSINIDVSSISLCTDEQIERFKKIDLLTEYIKEKQTEIENHNKVHNLNLEEVVNGRRLTNIGTFRAYILNYLKNHDGIHKGMIQMVRQLPPQGRGLPLEIYAFSNVTNWVKYENIQSDIFDHVLSVAPQFGLSIFQEPTGFDIKKAVEKI